MPALRVLAARDLDEGRRRARELLRAARPCRCCKTATAHVFDRIGSTLFYDDDPAKLREAFDPEERERFTPEILAAAILVHGRARVTPWTAQSTSLATYSSPHDEISE